MPLKASNHLEAFLFICIATPTKLLSFDVDALHNTLFWMKQIEHLPETSLNQQSTPCSPPVCGFNLSKRIEVLSNPAKRMCIQKCPKKKARSKSSYVGQQGIVQSVEATWGKWFRNSGRG